MPKTTTQWELSQITISLDDLEFDVKTYSLADKILKRRGSNQAEITYHFNSGESFKLQTELPISGTLEILQQNVLKNWEKFEIRIFATSHNIGLASTIC